MASGAALSSTSSDGGPTCTSFASALNEPAVAGLVVAQGRSLTFPGLAE